VRVLFEVPLQKFVELCEASDVVVVQPTVLELLDSMFGHGVGKILIGLGDEVLYGRMLRSGYQVFYLAKVFAAAIGA
jgi:hypothetical protein